MSAVAVHFYRGSENAFGHLVRAFTGSRFSHCEIEVGAVTFTADTRLGVCRVLGKPHPPEEWDFVRVPVAAPIALEDWLQARVGCRYDWPGILLSELLPLNRQAASRWYCSELVCAALVRAGVLPASQRATVSPGRLHHLLMRN